MKNRTAQAATIAVLLVALGIALVRKSDWRPKPVQEPQDAIYAMLAAARQGDVKTYLGSFTGQMETSLRQTLAETTESKFASYLRDSNAAIKGVAVNDPQKITDLEVKVRVEYVYQDRNEAQILYVEKGSMGWKISRTDSEERVKTLIPYGTPLK